MTAMYWIPRIVLGIFVAIYLLTFIDIEIIPRFFGLVFTAIFVGATFWMAFSGLSQTPIVRTVLLLAGSFLIISLLSGSDVGVPVVVITYLVSLVIEFKALAKSNPENLSSRVLTISAGTILGSMLAVAIAFGFFVLLLSGMTIR